MNKVDEYVFAYMFDLFELFFHQKLRKNSGSTTFRLLLFIWFHFMILRSSNIWWTEICIQSNNTLSRSLILVVLKHADVVSASYKSSERKRNRDTAAAAIGSAMFEIFCVRCSSMQLGLIIMWFAFQFCIHHNINIQISWAAAAAINNKRRNINRRNKCSGIPTKSC